MQPFGSALGTRVAATVERRGGGRQKRGRLRQDGEQETLRL